MNEESPEITYERWYPDVPPVMDSQQLAELLNTSDQIVRIWAREGVIPAHRAPGARKFKFLDGFPPQLSKERQGFDRQIVNPMGEKLRNACYEWRKRVYPERVSVPKRRNIIENISILIESADREIYRALEI